MVGKAVRDAGAAGRRGLHGSGEDLVLLLVTDLDRAIDPLLGGARHHLPGEFLGQAQTGGQLDQAVDLLGEAARGRVLPLDRAL